MPRRKSTNSRNLWTDHEDMILMREVEKYGGKKWKRVSASLPGKNHTQCLHRWHQVRHPDLKKGHWTKEEDDLLRSCVWKVCPPCSDPSETGHIKWTSIAEEMHNGRIGKQCRERWFNHLRANVVKGDWTESEDQIIIEFRRTHDTPQWSRLAQKLPGRTGDSVKNRWNCTLERKEEKRRFLATLGNMGANTSVSSAAYNSNAFQPCVSSVSNSSSISGYRPPPPLRPQMTTATPPGWTAQHDTTAAPSIPTFSTLVPSAVTAPAEISRKPMIGMPLTVASVDNAGNNTPHPPPPPPLQLLAPSSPYFHPSIGTSQMDMCGAGGAGSELGMDSSPWANGVNPPSPSPSEELISSLFSPPPAAGGIEVAPIPQGDDVVLPVTVTVPHGTRGIPASPAAAGTKNGVNPPSPSPLFEVAPTHSFSSTLASSSPFPAATTGSLPPLDTMCGDGELGMVSSPWANGVNPPSPSPSEELISSLFSPPPAAGGKEVGPSGTSTGCWWSPPPFQLSPSFPAASGSSPLSGQRLTVCGGATGLDSPRPAVPSSSITRNGGTTTTRCPSPPSSSFKFSVSAMPESPSKWYADGGDSRAGAAPSPLRGIAIPRRVSKRHPNSRKRYEAQLAEQGAGDRGGGGGSICCHNDRG